VKNKHIGALLGLGFLITAAPVFAHHGNSNFDIDKKLTLKATVTDWVWANPHCWLKFEATDDKGTVVHWIAETSNPADMTNLGWSKQVFKPGSCYGDVAARQEWPTHRARHAGCAGERPDIGHTNSGDIRA
jgi:hypothetical protein